MCDPAVGLSEIREVGDHDSEQAVWEPTQESGVWDLPLTLSSGWLGGESC